MNNHNSLFNPLLISLFLLVLMGSCKQVDPVLAEFTANPTEALAGDNIQFTNTSENANHYQWDFGDGNTSFEDSPSNVYEEDGRFDVKLIAIGEEDSDTATLEIDVYWPFEVTIFEGTGIEDIFVADPWSVAQSAYTSDTIYIRTYLESIEAFQHLVYYPEEGVVYFFINEDSIINNDDPLLYILLWLPYQGGTTEKVGIGSTMKRVIDSYGSPESTDEGDGYEGYWYDSKGVDFYTYGSGYVEEIWIYTKAAKKVALSKDLLRGNLNQTRIIR